MDILITAIFLTLVIAVIRNDYIEKRTREQKFQEKLNSIDRRDEESRRRIQELLKKRNDLI